MPFAVLTLFGVSYILKYRGLFVPLPYHSKMGC